MQTFFRWLKRLVVLAVLAGIAYAGYAYFNSKKREAGVVRYRTAPVVRADVFRTVEATGTVQPIQCELVTKFNVNELSMKNERDIEKLAIITKEGVEKNLREELYEKIQCVNKFVVGQLLISEPVISTVRRELKKLSDGINVEEAEVITLLRDSVLRREIVDETSEDVQAASNKVAKFYKQVAKKTVVKPAPKAEQPEDKPPAPTQSLSEQLLQEAANEEKQEGAATAQ